MSTRYKIQDPEGIYFITMTTVGWIDIFTRRKYKDILIESLRFCQQKKGLVLFAYVIMSNHIHIIAQAEGEANLIDIIRDFKKYTARRIIDAVRGSKEESRRQWLLYQMRWFAAQSNRKQDHRLWKSDYHPVVLISPKFTYQKLNYIHNNPVKAGLVEIPAHYVYSSAAYYEKGKGVLTVTILDFGITEGYVWMGG